ncbi:lysylphosphatidylglycerol synthase transmembrane domain-containing protein [candidate division KSB1 bacterium]
MKSAKKLSKLLPVIGILIFIWIFSKLDLESVFDIAKSIRWEFFALSIATGFIAIYIKSVKWKKIVEYSGLKYSTLNSFIAWLVGFAVGMITPGRVGDFYRAVYLKTSNKKPIGICFATVFFDRILDIIIMLFFAGLGILYLLLNYDLPSGKELAIVVAVMFVLGVIFLFVFRENIVKRIVRPLFYRFVPEKYHKSMKLNYKSFFSLFKGIMNSPSRIIILFIIGIIGWLLAFYQLYLLAIALNLNISYVFIGAMAPLISMIELIPISFSGIGTRDAAMIFFLALLGISKEASVAFSLLILVMIYVLALPGLIYWIKHPTELPEN